MKNKALLLTILANTRKSLPEDHLERPKGSFVQYLNKENTTIPSNHDMLKLHLEAEYTEVYNVDAYMKRIGVFHEGCNYYMFQLNDDFIGHIGVKTLGELRISHREKHTSILVERSHHQNEDGSGSWELVSEDISPIKTKTIFVITGPQPITELPIIWTWHPGLPTALPSSPGITDLTTVKLKGKLGAFDHLQKDKKPTFEEWLDSPEMREDAEMWGELARSSEEFTVTRDEEGFPLVHEEAK